MRKIVLTITGILYCSLTVFSQTKYYVDAGSLNNSGAGTSWATAKKDLQAAIIAAASGDQIWVKAGTYLPTHDAFGSTTPANNRDKCFLLKEGVKLYGGFAGTETQLNQRNWKQNVTILSGDLGVVNTLTDNAYHVVLSVNLTSASVLDGFTVTKGYATAPGLSTITVSSRVLARFKGAGIYNSNAATQFANLTVTQNSADCTDTNDDSWGAGMVSEMSTSTFTDCLFLSNSFLAGGGSFGVFGAGLLISGTPSQTLTRCVFANNSGGSGFFDGSRGGGLYIDAGAHTISNCIFYGNSSDNGAAMMAGGAEFNTSSFVNCTFANNTSRFAGTAYSGFTDAVFRNCILWNNTPTSTSVPGRNEIYSSETRSQYWPTFNNCIIRDASGSPLSVTNTVTSNVLNGNPLFVNYNDGDGADNIWGTADDGLRLQCSSPAVGAGTGSTPTTDFLGLTRTATLDIGAYEGEHANSSVNPLATAQTTVQLALTGTGVTNFSNCSNLVASVQSGSPYTVSGTVTATVWIQGTQPSGYVRRHYEITPATNTAAATSKVTLYFTQADFDAFNNQVPAPSSKLPMNSADATGKQNLLVEKRAGVSSNGTGLPSTYTGAITTINPNDADIVWNATSSRWEVSFDVTGFSGFFVKTVSATLPLTLVDINVNRSTDCNRLEWVTKDEVNTGFFIVEASTDGILFSKRGIVDAAGAGNHSYQFSDCSMLEGIRYYRLKMVDKDGEIYYSRVAVLPAEKNAKAITLYPSLVSGQLTIEIDDPALVNTWATLLDLSGRIYRQIHIRSRQNTLQTDYLQPGVYFIRFRNGATETFIKQ
ncbi:putative secreted protein (Por secretion system target) [Lacibacter cauensis]|uniref:Putative secreted protein (Por secretion system target) n=1 Tax=Lacibacter cauensis TaxID=510947 RepID=A0A562SYL3_9BACT|nr:right-handed parallel beta-helix repeat-containing protein [Lacibacter cauensis]TWI85796.1 putative secreted protein (Por secretion system target) [Lacibacter cauensis]